MTIRNYRPADLDVCRALWVELTDWHRQIYASPAIGGDDPGKQFDEHLEKVGADQLWVAEVDGAVVGLTGMISGEVEAELEPMVVFEAYRGRGIARRLCETAVEAARASGVTQFKVRPVARNESAIRYFHEMGFQILGHVEMFMDLAPRKKRGWRAGERLAGRDFEV